MRLSTDPATFRRSLNLWPPLLFAGIVVDTVSEDFRAIDVSLRWRWYNRTPSGAHFGGSLFAMTDPFYALMLRQALGRGYTIWDQAGAIRFVSPARGTVVARYRLDEATIESVRAITATGAKAQPEFSVEIHDTAGKLVATVEKTVYVRAVRRA